MVPLFLQADDAPRYAGATGNGFLLPNGWTIAPAGDQVVLTALPLNIIPLADGKHALAATSGFNTHDLSLIDLEARKIVAKETVRQSWFGLALNEKTGAIWWSGGGGDRLHTFTLKQDELTRTSEPEPVPPPREKGKAKAKAKAKDQPKPEGPRHFRSGVALAPDGKTLYSLDIDAGTITAQPLADAGDRQLQTALIASRPYDLVVAGKGTRLDVCDWT